ncbi:terpenoid synthase [Mycena epipterygia]|nr:terpenoid synthase [Mycena epipterygia]
MTVTTSSTTSSDQKVKMLYLPETMKKWPWPRAINPYYEEVSAESNAWFHGFKAFSEKSQYAFDKCDFGRLASLAYPTASREHLRTGCDLMNVFFVVDEYTDVESAPVVREMVDIVIDAMNNPHKPRPEGEILLGEVTRQFWELAIKTATPNSAKHFVEAFTDYLESVVAQAENRDSDTVLTVDSYLKTRRENIGVRPSYPIGELHLDLPDEAFYHPVIKELEYEIAELIILDNDIASYNKEQSVGDDRYNILTIVMHQFNFDLYGAMAWVVHYHEEVETRFLDALKRVPSFGPEVDSQLHEYIEHLANWPRCNDCWNFESGRYFGNKGLEFQKTRYVPLLPKVDMDRTLKRENVVVPLVPL